MQRSKTVSLWLWLGVVMIFVQILLGGITRLTGSGLSITKWEILTGTIPPLNAAEWDKEFNLYKETPQYQKINTGMSLSEFKFIYFWEYFHRIWARSIGFIFLFPFVVFSWIRWLNRRLYLELSIAVLLGALVATFGWIMVASGLINRPWVNAYKLTLHLNLALILYVWLLWISIGSREGVYNFKLKKYINLFTVFLAIQLVVGGLMSGLKAGLYYPTWPDMNGDFFPNYLIDSKLWTIDNIINYEKGPIPGIVQFVHRITGYTLFLLSCLIFWKAGSTVKNNEVKRALNILFLLTILQVCLGILTVLNCIGRIPLFLGVAHQATAILLLSIIVYMHRKIKR